MSASFQLHNRKCPGPPPFLPGESGARCPRRRLPRRSARTALSVGGHWVGGRGPLGGRSRARVAGRTRPRAPTDRVPGGVEKPGGLVSWPWETPRLPFGLGTPGPGAPQGRRGALSNVDPEGWSGVPRPGGTSCVPGRDPSFQWPPCYSVVETKMNVLVLNANILSLDTGRQEALAAKDLSARFWLFLRKKKGVCIMKEI